MYEKVEVKLSQLRKLEGIKAFELVEGLLELFSDEITRCKYILTPHVIGHVEVA